MSREKLLSVFRRIFKEEPLATVGRTIEKYEMSLLRSFFSEYRTIDIPETKISISLEWFTSDKTSPTFYFFVKEDDGERRTFLGVEPKEAKSLPFSSMTIANVAKKLDKCLSLYGNDIRSGARLHRFRLFLLNETIIIGRRENGQAQRQERVFSLLRQVVLCPLLSRSLVQARSQFFP